MIGTKPVPGVEWRVVWMWRFGSREKKKIYKTEKGAKTFYAKITSGDGTFIKLDDYGGAAPAPTITFHLVFARLERRTVQPWWLEEEWNAP